MGPSANFCNYPVIAKVRIADGPMEDLFVAVLLQEQKNFHGSIGNSKKQNTNFKIGVSDAQGQRWEIFDYKINLLYSICFGLSVSAYVGKGPTKFWR